MAKRPPHSFDFKKRPAWVEDVVYLLACLQKCGARLGDASSGRTAKSELVGLLDPPPAESSLVHDAMSSKRRHEVAR
ncbi:hypothetical protein PG988_011748 [Apiospora saccharicola]